MNNPSLAVHSINEIVIKDSPVTNDDGSHHCHFIRITLIDKDNQRLTVDCYGSYDINQPIQITCPNTTPPTSLPTQSETEPTP